MPTTIYKHAFDPCFSHKICHQIDPNQLRKMFDHQVLDPLFLIDCHWNSINHPCEKSQIQLRPQADLRVLPLQEPIDWRYLPYIRPIFQAYVREYPSNIWPYIVLTYLHFRILKFPLIISWDWLPELWIFVVKFTQCHKPTMIQDWELFSPPIYGSIGDC